MARWVGRRVHLGVFKGRLPGTASPGANRRFATLACFQGVLGVRGHKVPYIPPDGDSKIFIYIGRGTTGYSCVRVATSPLRKALVFRHRYFSNYVRPSVLSRRPSLSASSALGFSKTKSDGFVDPRTSTIYANQDSCVPLGLYHG